MASWFLPCVPWLISVEAEKRSRTQRILLICVGLCLFITAAFGQPNKTIFFEEFLTSRFSSATDKTPWSIEALCPVSTSLVAKRVLTDYGAMFSAADPVTLPLTCIHRGESQVNKYQAGLKTRMVIVDTVEIRLQQIAGDKLEAANREVLAKGLKISPLDGAIAGDRSYGDTLRLWNSRVFPAMDFWIRRGRLTEADRDSLLRLELEKRVEKILQLEAEGIYFSPSRTKSIMTSTAPPGVSQHLALIAFDVVEYSNPEVRAILNRNGWYQTIVDDPPHFTYLGVADIDLPSRGLRAVARGGQTYWVPNLSPKFGLKN